MYEKKYFMREGIELEPVGVEEDDDVMVMLAEEGKAFVINSSAAEVLRQLDKPLTIDELSCVIATKYSEEHSSIKKDISDIVKLMCEKRVLSYSDTE